MYWPAIFPAGLKAQGGALTRTCARAGSVKSSDGTTGSAQEAVPHIVGVDVGSRDRPRRMDGDAKGALASTCARAGSVENGDGLRGTTARLPFA
jgi:hypothetical protein